MSWLGPSLVLGGLPAALIYTDQAWGKAPDRQCARIALSLTLLEGAALLGFIAFCAASP